MSDTLSPLQHFAMLVPLVCHWYSDPKRQGLVLHMPHATIVLGSPESNGVAVLAKEYTSPRKLEVVR